MPCFDLRQLRAFVTVVDTGSFSQAAELLNQTQSAVSQLVQNLELGLECKLLDRSKRPVRPTIEGEELYIEGNRLLMEAKGLQDKIHSIKQGKLNRVKIGMVDSVLSLSGIELLCYFDTKADKVNQLTGTAPELLASLQSGKVDLIISCINQDVPQELEVHPILSEHFALIAPKEWPNKELSWLCKNKHYIEYESWTPTGSQTSNWLRWRKLVVNSQLSVSRAETVLGLVAMGYGWSLATATFLAINPEYLKHIDCIPLPEPGIKRDLAVICRKGEMANIMDEMVSNIREILLNSELKNIHGRWKCLESK